jgi:hypothetical protein
MLPAALVVCLGKRTDRKLVPLKQQLIAPTAHIPITEANSIVEVGCGHWRG